MTQKVNFLCVFLKKGGGKKQTYVLIPIILNVLSLSPSLQPLLTHSPVTSPLQQLGVNGY